MNSIKKEDINGVLNFIGQSSNFDKEFYRVKRFKLYSNQISTEETICGFICWFKEDRDIALKINISLKSFLNIKHYLNVHIKNVQTSQEIISTITNFYDINVIGAIVPFFEKEHYETHLVFEKDGKYLSVNAYISDIVCMCQRMNLPVYINKEIIEKKGIESSEVEYLLEDWEKEKYA